MPEVVLETPVTTESLGWRAGLPDNLKQNEAIVPFKTVGEFAQDYLQVRTKATDLEGKLKDYVPKLPDNATDADRSLYYDALGRPKTAQEYEFDGEDKNAPEWTGFWKDQFHGLGLTKTQAKALSSSFNGQMQKMVEAHNGRLKQEMTEAEQKLKSEWGDKFPEKVELAKRLYQKHLGQEFDKDFNEGTGANRLNMVRYLVKLASLTGEDQSPQAGRTVSTSDAKPGFDYSKSKMPPARI